MVKLTKLELGILEEGARHRDGVVRPFISAGYAGVNTRKAVRKLETLGLIEPNAHGDHYITPSGLSALQSKEAGE